MRGPEMAPQTPQPLVAPRRSRGAPRPPTRSGRPGEAVAPLDTPTGSARDAGPRNGPPDPPTARRAPAKPWRASTPHTLGAPRRSRGTPRYSDRLRERCGAPKWPPRPPNRSSRPGEAVARLDPPHARGAPAKPWHPSILRQAPERWGAPKWPPDPIARRAPAKPWRSSISRQAPGFIAPCYRRYAYSQFNVCRSIHGGAMRGKRTLTRKAFFVDEGAVRRARRTLGVASDGEAVRLALDRVNEGDRFWTFMARSGGRLKPGSIRRP